MEKLLNHIPVALIAFLILNLFVTNRALGGDVRVMITLLAPILWIGLYLIARAPTIKKD